jgi:propanol-preferring alcohol dehydrogenase
MRALLLESPQLADNLPLRLADISAPEPAAGQVRVRIRCCAVCHTDLHIVEGDLPLPKIPVVPGHQIVGTVDALGAGVHMLKAGDRVGIPWLYSTDGICPYCRRHTENLCEQARFTGYHENGGYAEYCVVREDFAHPLPAAFSDEHAAPLLCAGVIGYRAYRLSGAQPGQRVGLYGFGASAHLVLQLARHQGCEGYVFTRSPAHRQVAEELGAAWTGAAEDTPPQPLDAAIIFAPVGALVPTALRAVKKGGRVVCGGIHMSDIPSFPYAILWEERQVVSVANLTRADAREFLAIAPKSGVKTEVVRYPLERANDALDDLRGGTLQGAAVLYV